MDAPQKSEEGGKVKTTIVLSRTTYRRTRRAMNLSERNLSAEIEFALKRHLESVEKAYGLTADHLDDEHWPE